MQVDHRAVLARARSLVAQIDRETESAKVAQKALGRRTTDQTPVFLHERLDLMKRQHPWLREVL